MSGFEFNINRNEILECAERILEKSKKASLLLPVLSYPPVNRYFSHTKFHWNKMRTPVFPIEYKNVEEYLCEFGK